METNRALIDADDVTFDSEVLEASVPVLVDFVAPWCGPCKALAPLIERLAAETRGRAKMVRVDIEQAPAIAKRFAVRGVPTLVVFRGGERVATHVGTATRERMLELLSG